MFNVCIYIYIILCTIDISPSCYPNKRDYRSHTHIICPFHLMYIISIIIIYMTHICPVLRWTRWLRRRDQKLSNSPECVARSHKNYIQILYTTLTERFLGASVSVFKGCVTLWGGRWPMSVYVYIINTYSWKPEVIRTLLPILFTLPGPPPNPHRRKNERKKNSGIEPNEYNIICYHIPHARIRLNQSPGRFYFVFYFRCLGRSGLTYT